MQLIILFLLFISTTTLAQQPEVMESGFTISFEGLSYQIEKKQADGIKEFIRKCISERPSSEDKKTKEKKCFGEAYFIKSQGALKKIDQGFKALGIDDLGRAVNGSLQDECYGHFSGSTTAVNFLHCHYFQLKIKS